MASPDRVPLNKRNAPTTPFEEYNPWGRPGAGAPIRDETGGVVADYGVRSYFHEIGGG